MMSPPLSCECCETLPTLPHKIPFSPRHIAHTHNKESATLASNYDAAAHRIGLLRAGCADSVRSATPPCPSVSLSRFDAYRIGHLHR